MPSINLNYANVIAKDVSIYKAGATTNYEGQSSLYVGVNTNATEIWRTLLTFDLGLIPNDAIINSATLKLYKEPTTSAARTFDVHKITSAWVPTGVTWNTAPTFNAAPVASLSVGTAPGLQSFDVKSLVQDWVNGAPNNGLMLKANEETTINILLQAAANEASTTANRPILTIDYTIPSTGKKQVEYMGQGTILNGISGTSATYPLPAGVQQGDLLISHVITQTTQSVTLPSGWTWLYADAIGATLLLTQAYKFANVNEQDPVFSCGSNTGWEGAIAVFRNVKSVIGQARTTHSSTTTVFSPPSTITVTVDDSVFVLLNSFISANATPPLNFNELYDVVAGGHKIQSALRYMYNLRTLSTPELQTTLSTANAGIAVVLALEPKTNNTPTLTLTNPADNLVLSEGNTLSVQGSATDTNNGDTVTIKYKINSGVERSLHSAVSDGVNPISFSKGLTFSGDRLYDGATDVSGLLTEVTTHTLTVWADDGQGGVSVVETRSFTVVYKKGYQMML